MIARVPILTTARLKLSPFGPDDADDIIALANDYEVARTLARLPFPYGGADAEFFLTEVNAQERCWKVSLNQTHHMVGSVGLAPRSLDAEYELGYWYGKAHWGKGYATEAARAVVQYAFETLRSKRLISGYFEENPASGKVLEKVGFKATGQSQQFCLAQDKKLPHMDMICEKPDP